MSWILAPGKSAKGIGLIVGVGFLLILPGLFLPDPLAQNPEARFLSIRFPFSLGTDQLGRDLAARIYFGFLRSAGLISLTLLTTLIVALPAGLMAARHRRADTPLEVIAGAIWSIPTVILGLVVFIGFKGHWIPLKFAVLGLFNWVPIFRVVRDLTKQAQTAPYVTFARAMGMKERRIYGFHMLPNVLPGVFPTILLNLISLFEAEFVLAFLGLSYPDPFPTLGGLLRQGIAYLNFPMILLPSGLMALIVLAIVSMYSRINVRR
jgi:ABC-type dipeptide/oligopeptide/nickel transport system permease subunit